MKQRGSRGKPGSLYLVPIIGSLFFSVAWFVVQTWATSTAWYQSIPFGVLALVFGSFVAGLCVEDLASEDSWLRQRWADWNRLFNVEKVVPEHRTANQIEYLAFALTLRMVRDCNDAAFIIRIHEGVNVRHMDKVFVLSSSKVDVVKDQSLKRLLAIVPLKRYDSGPLGYNVWGDTYRPSGDASSSRHLLPGADNVVEIEMRCGWRVQREHVFLAMLKQDGDAFGRVFVATNETAGLHVLRTL